MSKNIIIFKDIETISQEELMEGDLISEDDDERIPRENSRGLPEVPAGRSGVLEAAVEELIKHAKESGYRKTISGH